jgi:APA family basic amino acid/polyamine antiporter
VVGKPSDTVGFVSTPVRRTDLVAGGVAASFGAGLFLGLAPAASIAGGWLPLAALLGVLVGGAAVLSTWDRPLATVVVPLRRFGFALSTLARLAAAVALAGTVAVYLTPFAALAVVVVATALAAVGVPAVAVRVAAVVVVGVLLLVVIACFAIAPAAPAVAAPGGGSVAGVLGAAGLLAVCMFGAGWSGPGAGGRAVEAAGRGGAAGGTGLESDGVSHGDGGAPGDGDVPGAPAGAVVEGAEPDGDGVPVGVEAWRWGRFLVVGIVAVVVLAVVVAAVRQLGAARLAISPAPLRAALDAADAGAMQPLLLIAVVVACGFSLMAVLRGLPAAGVPHIRVVVAAGVVTVVGVLVIPPTAALAGAAVLLLGDSAFRLLAARHLSSGLR